MKRIIRDRCLTPAEAAENNAVRQQIEQEKPEINARILSRLGKKEGVLTPVSVTVVNPADASRRWEGTFLVDTEVTDCYVPGNRLREIGIEPHGQRTYELADGSEQTYPIGIAQIELLGEVTGGNVVFGEDNAEPRLGFLALASIGLEVDPLNQQLKRGVLRLRGIKSKNG